ncbi:MAG: SpoIIE family protein phosphatase [Thermoanaerobaculia bacterium]|nr:SpoIIE family protein phosphatase [Thermoanaerobaculia bacterium]
MTPPSGIEAETAEWLELARLAGDAPRDSEYLKRLLDAYRQAREAEAAALYFRFEDTSLQRHVAIGEPPLPARLEQTEGGDLDLLSWSGGAVACRAPQRDAPAPLTTLLATALEVSRQRQQLKRQGFEAKLRGVQLEALYDVGLAITSMLDMEELSEAILLRAVSLLDARRGALYLLEDERFALQRTIGGDAAETIQLDDPVLAALLRGEAVGEQALVPGAVHLLLEPIESEAGRRGLLIVADKESRTGVGPFGRSDQRTLELFANQAAIALENARLHREALEKERLEREMELASEIQRRLLPTTIPVVPGFELYGWSRPAQQVGGDYYDLIVLGDGRCGLVVGDVSGKGMPAALMVSTVHSALRLLLDRLTVGPELIERLNRHISETSAPNKFITFFLAEVVGGVSAGDRSEMRFLNAGHNPALLVSPSGEMRRLETCGLPLGLLPDSTYDAGSVGIGPGDLLCVYSDGITEAVSPDDEQFGMSRLCEVLVSCREEPLETIVATIDRTTAEFAGGMPQADDQTLVLVRRRVDD